MCPQTFAVAKCSLDYMASHTLPLGDLRETREEIEEDKSLQNSGGGNADVCEGVGVG